MITTLDLVDDDIVLHRFIGSFQGNVGYPLRAFASVAEELPDKVISDRVLPDEAQLLIRVTDRCRFEAKPARRLA